MKTVLIVGLGSSGSRHARIVRECMPAVEIVGLRHRGCDSPPLPPIDRCVSSIHEALLCRPDAAVIASPAPCHIETATPLAKAGVHLLVEKPISSSTAGVSALIEICRAQGVVLMTGYNLRFLACMQRFKELLSENRAGRILSVRAEVGQYLPSWRPDSDYRRQVSAQAALGGGALLELSHEIDYLRWLFGEVSWVSAVVRRHSDLEIDVEDTAHLTLGLRRPAPGGELVASLNLDFVRHDSTRSCTVIGDAATLRWDAIRGSVSVFDAGGSDWQTLFAEKRHADSSYREEWRHFVDCVTTGQPPHVTGEDGLAVLAVIDAARVSSSSGTTRSIPRDRDPEVPS